MSRIARSKALALLDPAQRLVGRLGVARHHAPLGGLQRRGRGGWWRCRRRSACAGRCSSGWLPRKSRRLLGGQLGHGRVDREVEGRALARARRSRPTCVPPISSASRLLIARPRPVPPYLRVVEASACAERLEQAPHAFGREADAGVAHRERQLGARRLPCGVAVTVSTTSPCSVNLTALASRLSRIWRSRVTSPSIAARHLALEQVGGVEVLLGRARASPGRAPTRRTRAGRTDAPRCPCARPRSSRSRGCR